MPKISRKIAEAQLASLQQSLAAFAFRNKTFPPKELQQVVYQAEQAYYERSDLDFSSPLGASWCGHRATAVATVQIRSKTVD